MVRGNKRKMVNKEEKKQGEDLAKIRKRKSCISPKKKENKAVESVREGVSSLNRFLKG